MYFIGYLTIYFIEHVMYFIGHTDYIFNWTDYNVSLN